MPLGSNKISVNKNRLNAGLSGATLGLEANVSAGGTSNTTLKYDVYSNRSNITLYYIAVGMSGSDFVDGDATGSISIGADGKGTFTKVLVDDANIDVDSNNTSVRFDISRRPSGSIVINQGEEFTIINDYPTERYFAPQQYNPNLEANVVLWLDANSSANITTVSGNVSAWDNRIDHGKTTFTQDTLTSRPEYDTGNSVVLFDGVDDDVSIADNLGQTGNPGYYLISVIQKVDSTNAANINAIACMAGGGGATGDRGTAWITGQYTNQGENTGWYYDSSGYSPGTSAFIRPGVHSYAYDKRIFAFNQFLNDPIEDALLYSNGTPYNSGGGQFNSGRGDQTSELWRIGCGTDRNTGVATHHAEVKVYEMVYLANALDDSTTFDLYQKIEGYLAHKWDLESELPVTHPYKTNPPYRWT